MTSNKTFLIITIYTNIGRPRENQINSKRLYKVGYASRERLKGLAILENLMEECNVIYIQ